MSDTRRIPRHQPIKTVAVVLGAPEHIGLQTLDLPALTDEQIVVDLQVSGISTGTEKLLYTGQMPSFPGMGYPLVPGYESVGIVSKAGTKSGLTEGQTVFVPGAQCYGEIRGLFGGSAKRLLVPGVRAVPIDAALGADAALIALAATAYHAVAGNGQIDAIRAPELIVGHGVLGRLLARMTIAAGFAAPTVWEIDPVRAAGAQGYTVCSPADDPRRDYRNVYDVSGDSAILDTLISRMAAGGEIVLAGFYSQSLNFMFAPAFMREVRIRVAAQWGPWDLRAVTELLASGQLSLAGLITHTMPATAAAQAYHTAFNDPHCLKMVLDWRHCA
jgi:3-hydroxyethyl bacteriochlorophyllide a dehydrogenase